MVVGEIIIETVRLMGTSLSGPVDSAFSFPMNNAARVPASPTAALRCDSGRTTRNVLSLFKRKEKSIWPNPELSVGRLCPSNCSTSIGYCWEAVGPAAEAYGKIAEQIRTLFQNQSDYLDEKEEQVLTFSFGLWMVGRSKHLAVPTIILGCQSPRVRSRAKEVLKQSGLLDPYPGIVIRTISRTPTHLASNNASTRGITLADILSRPESDLWGVEAAQDRCTTRIFFQGMKDKRHGGHGAATMGKFVLVDGVAHGLTVSHLFDHQEPTVAISKNQDKMTSKANHRQSESFDAEEPVSFEENFTIGTLSKRSNEHGPDWALINLESKLWKSRNKIMLPSDRSIPGNEDKQFVLCEDIVPLIKSGPAIIATGRATSLSAYISSTPTFTRFQGTKNFTKTWPLHTEYPLGFGDCGSWIVDPRTGDLYGHVVAAHFGSCLNYFVAAKDVFDSVRLNHNCTISLPPKQLETIPKREAIFGKLSLTVHRLQGLNQIPALTLVATCEKNEYISPHLWELEDRDQHSEEQQYLQRGVPIARRVTNVAPPSHDGSFPPRSPRGKPRNREWLCQVDFDVTAKPISLFLSFHDPKERWVSIAHVRLEADPQNCLGVPQWLEVDAQTSFDLVPVVKVLLSLRFDNFANAEEGSEDFQIHRLIRKGVPGRTFLARKNDTQRFYAMKAITRQGLGRRWRRLTADTRFYDILQKINSITSPFVAIAKFSFESLTDTYICTDYFSGGELSSLLQKSGKFAEKQGKFYTAEILCGLKAYHDQGLAYGSLNLDNVMLNARGHIVLSNFEPLMTRLRADDGLPVCMIKQAAPEILLGEDRSILGVSDFWSLGILLFEMVCGRTPFYGQGYRTMSKKIQSEELRIPPDAFSAKGGQFVKGLLTRDPRYRLGATNGVEDLMVHPWFAELPWEQYWQGMAQPPFQPLLDLGQENEGNRLNVSLNAEAVAANNLIKSCRIDRFGSSDGTVSSPTASSPMSSSLSGLYYHFGLSRTPASSHIMQTSVREKLATRQIDVDPLQDVKRAKEQEGKGIWGAMEEMF